MNSVNLIGNIGHDLELRYTQSGKAVLNLNIAVTNYNGEAEWFRIVIWNQQAENTVKYCRKGSKIGITGRLATNKYTDNQGEERTNVEVVAQSVEFLSYENNQGSNGNNQQNYSQNNNYQSNQNQQQTANNQQNKNNQQNNSRFEDYDKEDPLESNNNITDISDDDLPF